MAQSPAVQEILQPEDLRPHEHTPRTVAALAREHTEQAVETLVKIVNSPMAADGSKILAANSLLDRGHGKPPQAVLVAEQRPQIDYSDPRVRRDLARRIAFFLGGVVPE